MDAIFFLLPNNNFRFAEIFSTVFPGTSWGSWFYMETWRRHRWRPLLHQPVMTQNDDDSTSQFTAHCGAFVTQGALGSTWVQLSLKGAGMGRAQSWILHHNSFRDFWETTIQLCFWDDFCGEFCDAEAHAPSALFPKSIQYKKSDSRGSAVTPVHVRWNRSLSVGLRMGKSSSYRVSKLLH